MSIRNRAIDLYFRLELPKSFSFLQRFLNSRIHRKWFVPSAFLGLLIFKKSTIGKYFLLENRIWVEKSYQPKKLAPFYPSVGDIPGNLLKGSLEVLLVGIQTQLQDNRGRSISLVRYWLNQKEIPPAIVIEPPLSRSPFPDAEGYLLDGNHRAIAMALRGELVRAYVGIVRPRTQHLP